MTRMNICALALAVWLVFLVLAVALGAVREAVLLPALGEPAAHVVGTLLVVAAMLAVMVPFVRRVRPHGTTTDLWLIGLLWMTLTVAFEFLFFHFVAGVPWGVLLADYNIFAGRIWVLVLLTLLFGPAVIGRMAGH